MTSETHAHISERRPRAASPARLISEDMAAEYQAARAWDMSGQDVRDIVAEYQRRLAEARGSEA